MLSRRSLIAGASLFAVNQGRINARPKQPTGERYKPGTHKVRVPRGRDAELYIPASANPAAKTALVISLHGAGGNAGHGQHIWQEEAERNGFAVLAPASRQATWDVIMGGFGPDVTAIDKLLSEVFDRLDVAPDRIAISGFSDGASYALSLGVMNGDLFRDIIAFSPGFLTATATEGKPRIFVSHGTRDEVLSIERCSRVLVPKLRHAGYRVEYREFDGPHTIPAAVRADAVKWWDTAR